MTADDFLASTTIATLAVRFRQEWAENEQRRARNRRDPALVSAREEFECQLTSHELTRAIVLVLASCDVHDGTLKTRMVLADLVQMARFAKSTTSTDVEPVGPMLVEQVDEQDQREEVGGCAGCGAKFFDMITALEHDCDGTLKTGWPEEHDEAEHGPVS